MKAEGAFLWRLQALDVSQNPLWIGASALLQQAPAVQLLIYTEAQQYVARRSVLECKVRRHSDFHEPAVPETAYFIISR